MARQQPLVRARSPLSPATCQDPERVKIGGSLDQAEAMQPAVMVQGDGRMDYHWWTRGPGPGDAE
jgi:hypothetical protein